MEHINNKSLYAAVMFAKKMIRGGMAGGLAVYKAARYYGVSESDVAYYVRQKETKKTNRMN